MRMALTQIVAEESSMFRSTLLTTASPHQTIP
jgi:hypothetical protein